MKPIPFEIGQLQFEIVREASWLSLQQHPAFTLCLERERQFGTKSFKSKDPILFGKKRPFNSTANYLITRDRPRTKRDS